MQARYGKRPMIMSIGIFCYFGQKWCSWIGFCISSTSFSVLINGSPAGFFNSSRGVRQGDPLSLFLFVIVMETFSRMAKVMVDHSLFSGFTMGAMGSEQVHILHLLFADDMLVFSGASLDQVQAIDDLLICFELVSGLKVNLAKSTLVPVGEVSNVEALAEVLGCEVGSLPIKYLGLPLGDKASWNGVVKKSFHTLASWKRMYLSKGGRIALIKSTLSNFPTFLLSILPILVAVAKAHRVDPMRLSLGLCWRRVQVSPGKLAKGLLAYSGRGFRHPKLEMLQSCASW
jgi:hypothetical protein